MENHLTAGVVSNDVQFCNHVLANTINGTTYAGLRARTTAAPQQHWFGGFCVEGGIRDSDDESRQMRDERGKRKGERGKKKEERGKTRRNQTKRDRLTQQPVPPPTTLTPTGPSGDPRSAGIHTAEAIKLCWSSHREIIYDWGPVADSWEGAQS